MNSDLPKVMHPLGGAPLFAHSIFFGQALEPERVVLVTGHGGEQVAQAAVELGFEVDFCVQKEQLGTGHAVAQAAPALAGFSGDAVVLYGDTPFISAQTLQAMRDARNNHDVVVLGFDAADPGRYGRLILNGERLDKIVEFKDAEAEERLVTLCNSGVVMANAAQLFDLVNSVGNDNASGEYYLTDIVEIANARGLSCTVVRCDEAETLGINTRAELAAAETIFQNSMRKSALEIGVTLSAPETVFFSHDTTLGRDVHVEQNVVFAPGVTVETGAKIRAFSHLEGCHVSAGAIVGPYARLRPGAEIGNDARVGNFVEIKNATLGEGAKANHLTYIGDATVGDRTNIGAGTVTCNYNGVEKFRTEIGADAFIGSDTMLVAPVKIGAEAMTASGSVITKDVPEAALALGRAEQVTKPGAGRRLFDMYKLAKANRQRKT
ncbi:N-acetylglucosamine-1-phosphate uridyltransferase [Candidatus Rhodobacter oscarellae]|uniref:Bifunctional protein GlmU n=2 Tax=Candidatus Rhodobacter oscarellae TaxID=1675527 RepID=A0A0J9GSL4_9RHOB|nr:N-acetylglucosamine-1-phosphate uridyltransferase [Candidatus Rhodobacter lobularis]